MEISIYTDRPDAYEPLFKLMKGYDYVPRFLSVDSYDDESLSFCEDDVFIADPRLLEKNDRILDAYRKSGSEKPYIIAAPMYPMAILSEIRRSWKLTAIPAESKIHEYKHLPSEVSETYKKYIFDENINKSVDKGIKEIIKEENSNSVDDIFDLDEHKDEKSFQEHDNFREDVLKVVMRLSDIIMTIMEKGFDNGNFDVRESLNQVGFAVKEMNIEEKTQANSIRTFEESKGDIYNEKDITSLYTEPELIEYNNIFEDKDVS